MLGLWLKLLPVQSSTQKLKSLKRKEQR